MERRKGIRGKRGKRRAWQTHIARPHHVMCLFPFHIHCLRPTHHRPCKGTVEGRRLVFSLHVESGNQGQRLNRRFSRGSSRGPRRSRGRHQRCRGQRSEKYARRSTLPFLLLLLLVMHINDDLDAPSTRLLGHGAGAAPAVEYFDDNHQNRGGRASSETSARLLDVPLSSDSHMTSPQIAPARDYHLASSSPSLAFPSSSSSSSSPATNPSSAVALNNAEGRRSPPPAATAAAAAAASGPGFEERQLVIPVGDGAADAASLDDYGHPRSLTLAEPDAPPGAIELWTVWPGRNAPVCNGKCLQATDLCTFGLNVSLILGLSTVFCIFVAIDVHPVIIPLTALLTVLTLYSLFKYRQAWKAGRPPARRGFCYVVFFCLPSLIKCVCMRFPHFRCG